jgi:hypothetical protein
MNRRHVLHGLVACVPLFAGCSLLTGDDGGNASTNTESNATSTSNGTTATATDVAETIRETVTRTTTSTATATPTATATATPSATPTPTPLPTAMPTVTAPQPTTGRELTEQAPTSGATPRNTATGTAVIDPAQLTRYTNRRYSYSVKRPAGWIVDESDPTQVIFEPQIGLAQEQALVFEDVGASSLDRLVSTINGSFKGFFDEYRVLNQQEVTLPNGNPGAVLDVRITDSALGDFVLRGKSVYTIADGTAYGVLVFVANNSYTSTVEAAMTEIVESLTIRGRVTSRPL